MHDTLCYVPSTTADITCSGEIAGGTTGEPSKSDVEKGKRYHEHLLKNLIKVIEMLKGQK